MKRHISLLLAVLMLFSFAAGCGKEEEKQAGDVQTEFRLEECGLAYTIPEEWTTMENANLIPSSYADAEGDIYAKVQYNYAPDENLDELNDMDSEVPVEELMTPLTELLVVHKDKLKTDAVKEELALFNETEELPKQGDYRFFYLMDYASGIEHFSREAKKTFRALEDGLPAFRDSIETFEPNVKAVENAAEENEGYLNFLSNTIEGDPADSTMFYDYDMTVVNFWASYCYPKINELGTLEKFYQELQKKYPNVNFVQVVIDTPEEKAEQVALDAYKEAGVTFKGIMPDENMAGWITENLGGLPTTIFVDAFGKPMMNQDGELIKLEGIKEKDEYMQMTADTLKDAPAKEKESKK